MEILSQRLNYKIRASIEDLRPSLSARNAEKQMARFIAQEKCTRGTRGDFGVCAADKPNRKT